MDYTVYQKVTLFILATATTLIGVFMAGMRIRNVDGNKVLRSSRSMMAVAFFFLGFPAFITVLFKAVPDYVVYLSFCLDTMSYSLLVLAAFQIVSGKPVKGCRHLAVSVLTLAALALLVFIVYMESKVPVALRIVAALAYAAVSVYLGINFHVSFKSGKSPIRRWAAVSFYATLLMSFFSGMVLTSPFFAKNPLCDIIIFLYTFLNVAYAIVFSNSVFQFNIEKRTRSAVSEDVLDDRKAALLKEKLDGWVEEKCYLQDDAVEDVVSALGTDLDFLRQYFRVRMPSDFRTWRISLRIEYAKKLINEDPSISMNVLSGKAGFVSRSNFYHYFKKITGETPAEYKERILNG